MINDVPEKDKLKNKDTRLPADFVEFRSGHIPYWLFSS